MEWLTANPLLCIGWIIVGAIAGAIARTMMKRGDAPFIQDVILGLIGSAVGGLVAGFVGLGPGSAGGIERVIINLVIAVVGAVIVLFIGQAVLRR